VSDPGRSTLRVVVALVALALGGFAIGTTEFVSMGLLPQIATDLGASIPDGGHLISAHALDVSSGRRSWPCWRPGSRAPGC
jgi:DHA1 family inner membrane transport protein